jgi:hypothetical protein
VVRISGARERASPRRCVCRSFRADPRTPRKPAGNKAVRCPPGSAAAHALGHPGHCMEGKQAGRRTGLSGRSRASSPCGGCDSGCHKAARGHCTTCDAPPATGLVRALARPSADARTALQTCEGCCWSLATKGCQQAFASIPPRRTIDRREFQTPATSQTQRGTLQAAKCEPSSLSTRCMRRLRPRWGQSRSPANDHRFACMRTRTQTHNTPSRALSRRTSPPHHA